MKIKRMLKYYYLKIIRLRDEPKKIAMGLAVGTSIMFLPFFGIGIFVAYFAAALLRINRIATVITTVFWHWALAGFYALNVMVGKSILGGSVKLAPTVDHTTGIMGFFNFKKLGSEFLLGGAINSVIAGIIVYYLALKLLQLRKASKIVKHSEQ